MYREVGRVTSDQQDDMSYAEELSDRLQSDLLVVVALDDGTAILAKQEGA